MGDIRMQELICEECSRIAQLLMDKNHAYGNSVAQPANVFAKSDAMEQMNVRIDDKLNRIKKGEEYGNEDTELDLIGYLILKRCVRRWLHDTQAKKNVEEWEVPDKPSYFTEQLSHSLDKAADLFLANGRGRTLDTPTRHGVSATTRTCSCDRVEKASGSGSDPA